jgi:hypothetical protein
MPQISLHAKSDNGSRTPLTSTGAVIDALGGTVQTAWLVGLKPPAVSNWRHGASFPARTFLLMTEALAKRGFSAPPRLWDMEPRPRAKRSAKAEDTLVRDDLWSPGGGQ